MPWVIFLELAKKEFGLAMEYCEDGSHGYNSAKERISILLDDDLFDYLFQEIAEHITDIHGPVRPWAMNYLKRGSDKRVIMLINVWPDEIDDEQAHVIARLFDRNNRDINKLVLERFAVWKNAYSVPYLFRMEFVDDPELYLLLRTALKNQDTSEARKYLEIMDCYQ